MAIGALMVCVDTRALMAQRDELMGLAGLASKEVRCEVDRLLLAEMPKRLHGRPISACDADANACVGGWSFELIGMDELRAMALRAVNGELSGGAAAG